MSSEKNISRRDKSSVKVQRPQPSSVPDGTAGIAATGILYRAHMPNGTENIHQGGFL